MSDLTRREPIYDPQELERLLIARENAGDVDGMTALFEPDAVIDLGDGRLGRRFKLGEQRPALICGDLALTSTRSIDGDVTTEVARRQVDGTWLWIIDRYSVTW